MMAEQEDMVVPLRSITRLMNEIIRIMNMPWGRGVRMLVGLDLIGAGIQVVGGAAGAMLVVVGSVLLFMGLWGHCLIEAITPRQLPEYTSIKEGASNEQALTWPHD